MKSNVTRLSLVTLALVLILSGKAPVSADETLTYRLKWLYNASVVGDVYAVDKGYFTQKGLSVTVKAGSPERDAIRELELGQAQFGTASADQVITARQKGAPVVVIAQLFQKNPLQWIYRPDRGIIHGMEDLRGKTIGITYGGNDETIMRALLKKHDIDEHDVSFHSVRYDYTPFFRKQVNIWPVYINTQGIILQDKFAREDEHVRFFDPSQHGIRFVANSVVTSMKMIKERPETVKTFITVLLKAWEDALSPENREQALKVLALYDRDTPPDIRAKQLAATRPLIHPEHGRPLGTIDKNAWVQTESIMREQGLIRKPVSILDILYQNGEAPKSVSSPR